MIYLSNTMKSKKNNDTSARELINEMKLILRDTPVKLSESLMFGEDAGEEPIVDEVPSDNPLQHNDTEREPQHNNPQPFKAEDNEKTAQATTELDGEIKPLLDKIRVITLQGIAKLANNPTSESYQVLKRIWQQIDKVAENANKTQNEGI